MDEATRNQIWNTYLQFPAFRRYHGEHWTELGALEDGERVFAGWTVQFCEAGIMYCRTGDWGNIAVAKRLEDFPGPL